MSAPRQRIIDAMPEIEEIIDNENRAIGTGGECCDVRPAVVRCIQEIFGLKTITASEEREMLDKAAERLSQAKKLIEKARPFSVIRGLEDVQAEVEAIRKSKPRATGRLAANRKQLAAQLACDLMLELGGGPLPTLSHDGRYFRLANLLHNAATGKNSDLHRACKEHFAARKAEGEFDLYSSHLQMVKNSKPIPPELKRLTVATRAEFRARRAEAARTWRTLQQIVDEALTRRPNKA